MLFRSKSIQAFTVAAAFAGALFATSAAANPFPLFSQRTSEAPAVATPQDPEENGGQQARLRRQIVEYRTGEAPGTIIIDTPHTYLYFVLGNGRAMRYGIGVGREGFTWSGTETVTAQVGMAGLDATAEMVQRQPYLPRFMAGGPQNPLGARAMYLGGTVYRIHGTNAPATIGGRVSSGCIRLTNDDVIDLYGRVNVGTKVIVLPAEHHAGAATGSRG